MSVIEQAGKDMIDKVQKFCRNAKECLQMAEQIRSPEHKATLLRLAKDWNELAEDVTRARAKDGDPEVRTSQK